MLRVYWTCVARLLRVLLVIYSFVSFISFTIYFSFIIIIFSLIARVCRISSHWTLSMRQADSNRLWLSPPQSSKINELWQRLQLCVVRFECFVIATTTKCGFGDKYSECNKSFPVNWSHFDFILMLPFWLFFFLCVILMKRSFAVVITWLWKQRRLTRNRFSITAGVNMTMN